MFELIPCVVGALVSVVLAARVRPGIRLAIASLAGVLVAILSGEAATWPLAMLLDAILAAASGVAVIVAQRLIVRAGRNRHAVAAIASET